MDDLEMTSPEVLGRMAYEAYCSASDYKSLVSGADLPRWGEQDPKIREAWRAAADAVAMYCQSRGALPGGGSA